MMSDYDRARIEKLRLDAIKPDISYKEFYDYFNLAYIEDEHNISFSLRVAHAMKRAYENWTVSIEPGELIVGRPAFREHSGEEREAFDRANYAAKFMHQAVGQDSHMTIDYERVLRLGTSGIAELIDKKLGELNPDDPISVKKTDFYKSCKVCLSGVEVLAERYAELAENLASECSDTEVKQRDEYLEIARVCRRVPRYPANNFREAIQAVCFITYAISVKPMRPSMLQYQLGHPDRYLYPYYLKDKEDGIIDDRTAQTLIDCMCIQINRRVISALSSGFMIGGRLCDGTPVANELTGMCIRAIEQVRLVYPSVGFCVCRDTPEKLLYTAIDVLSKGHSHPAIFNDDVIEEGLRYYGLPPEEACEYIHSTCVEITPVASSNVWVASPYMNLPGELNEILPDECEGMDELIKLYFDSISKKIGENCRVETLCRYERAKYCIDPLLSCFVRDCLEKGVDIEEGGARYNWIMPSFVGLANAADALYTIREMVFNRKEITLRELKAALRDNFKNEQFLLAKINSLPKYGNDIRGEDSPDAYVKLISEFIADRCEKAKVPFNNGKLIPSLFCWVMHDRFGQSTGATADGRAAGFPLGDGSGPAQGREKNGPTASLLSSTSWNHTRFIGGIAVNIKFMKSMLDESKYSAIASLIKTYLTRGGFELQINVTNRETLERAIEKPEEYSDLVVRVGGYSDYFIRLSPTMQAEVLKRTEHTI